MEMHRERFEEQKPRRIPVSHVPSEFSLEVVIRKEQVAETNLPCSNCSTREYMRPVYGSDGKIYCSESCMATAESDSKKE